MHPWPSPESGWVWAGLGSWLVGMRVSGGHTGLRRPRVLPDLKKTHQGREGGALPNPLTSEIWGASQEPDHVRVPRRDAAVSGARYQVAPQEHPFKGAGPRTPVRSRHLLPICNYALYSKPFLPCTV